jgi:MFS family permease
LSNLTKRRVGRGLVLLIALFLLVDGLVQFASPPPLIAMMGEIGFPPDAGRRVAFLTLSCAILLAIPVTAPYGGLLTTAFLGGAICAHFRLGEVGSPPQLICLAIGFVVWLGLALADPRLRPLLALREDKKSVAPPPRLRPEPRH